MIEQKISETDHRDQSPEEGRSHLLLPFAMEDIIERRLCDNVIITLVPLITMLPDVGRVMTRIQTAYVIYNGKQRVTDEE